MTITSRPGTPAETPVIYGVMVQTFAELERRIGLPEVANVWLDLSAEAARWEHYRPRLEHLERTAEQVWVAKCEGQTVGYARSTRHDGVRELTELFVLSAHQGAGIGRELPARAFPRGGARRRLVIATREVPALSRYLMAGVYPYVTIYAVFDRPQPVDIATALAIEPAPTVPETLALLREVDAAVLGFARDADHAYLSDCRPACLYRRSGRVVGYGYFGERTGPIALLEPSDFSAVLARAETEAATRSEEDFRLNVRWSTAPPSTTCWDAGSGSRTTQCS